MDAKKLLDDLLGSGKQLVQQSTDFAERNLGLPPAGEKRDAMVSNLGKGALVGGLLAVLLGTKTGRRASGKIVKYGSLAAVAAVAYKAYQSWQSSSSSVTGTGQSIAELSGNDAHQRGLLLIRTMIASANADGHIDEDERSSIQQHLSSLGLGEQAARMLQQEIASPLNAVALAAQVSSTAEASEVYTLSKLIIDEANAKELAFLDQLASLLNLPQELRVQIDDSIYAN